MKRAAFVFFLILLIASAFVVRCWNLRDVFVQGGVFFVDADCYSRMTRARMVDEGEALFIRHHNFENHPVGTRPHTTAPMDWLIVAGRWIAVGALRAAGGSEILKAQTLDVSGAVLPALLGALTCGLIVGFLPRAAGAASRGGVWAAGVTFAICPILVHGTLLGRPDHQALLIPLLALALIAELVLAQNLARRWAIVAGASWGAAWWVSLYEPVVLLAVVAGFWTVADRRRFSCRECRAGWIVFGAFAGLSVAIEGWRVTLPEPAMREAFARWSQQIGELRHASAALIFSWLGWLGAAAPVLLLLRKSRGSMLLAALFAVLLGLTFWQVRWGYFLALVFTLSLPWMFFAMRRGWVAWPVFIVALWPVAKAWEIQLFPDDETLRRLAIQRAERLALRQIAVRQGARDAGPFVAAWWHSPAIAYWSRQPAVAGSSHQSLPGIVDSARIYLAPDEMAALPILRARGVKWILSDSPDRIVPTSASLLGVPSPEKCLATRLVRRVAPTETSLETRIVPETEVPRPPGNDFFEVWRVLPEPEPATVPPK